MAATLLLALAGCGEKQPEAATVDTAALATEIGGAGLFTDELSAVDATYVSTVMYLDTEKMESFDVRVGAGATSEEYGVFTCTSADAAAELVGEIEARIEAQKVTYEPYRPEAIPLLNNAVLMQKGQYVVYIVAEEYGQALEIAEKYMK